MAYQKRTRIPASSKTETEDVLEMEEEKEEVEVTTAEAPVVPQEVETTPPTPAQPAPTGKIFIGEEDRRLLKKFNSHIVKKLGMSGNRSHRI
jgi:hypothetical protein